MPVNDWKEFLTYPKSALLHELAETQQELADLHEEIAFTRASELTNPSVKGQRYMDEGHRSALVEKKTLIQRLLDASE